jgi:hypothetical protein
MSSEKEKSELDDLFGEPALIAGEDKARYLKLYAAVEASIRPKTIFDKMMVRDQTDKYWEEMRYKRSAAALIDGAFMRALQSLLEPICETTFDTPAQIAHDYYSGDAKTKREAIAQLAKYGITTEQIQAKAVQNIGAGLQMIDRMIVSRETARRILRKEHERTPVHGDAQADQENLRGN